MGVHIFCEGRTEPSNHVNEHHDKLHEDGEKEPVAPWTAAVEPGEDVARARRARTKALRCKAGQNGVEDADAEEGERG